MRVSRRVLASIVFVVLAACGSEQFQSTASVEERPTVVATTNILGDVVENLAGDRFTVVTIMPVGSDPHDFQPSAKDVATIGKASAIIVNGAGFEEGLLDVIEAAEADGVPVFEAISAVAPLGFNPTAVEHDEHGDHDEADADEHDDHDAAEHDEHADDDDHDDAEHDDHDAAEHDEHADEHDDGHDHAVGGVDPHFFTDPARMGEAAEGIVEFLVANVDTVDAAELEAGAADYIDSLRSLDAEVASTLAEIADERRVLVTNHQVFGYFADRYDFLVVATVVSTGSTADGVSGQRLANLAELLERRGISTVFTDTSASDELARTLASEVGDVEVVKLFSESLGAEDSDGATYVEMVRSNASQIADALAG